MASVVGLFPVPVVTLPRAASPILRTHFLLYSAEALGMCPSGSSSVPAVDARGDHGVGQKKREANVTALKSSIT